MGIQNNASESADILGEKENPDNSQKLNQFTENKKKKKKNTLRDCFFYSHTSAKQNRQNLGRQEKAKQFLNCFFSCYHVPKKTDILNLESKREKR